MAVPAGFDPKAVEVEVQRQLAARKREMQKTLEPPASPAGKAARDAGAPVEKAPARAKDEPPASESGRAAAPAEAPTTKTEAAAAPEPTAVATHPAAAPPSEAPARAAPGKEAEVARGDLVGPGPGVVEPALVAPPRFNYPAIARQQRISGRVTVLVLVDENGTVSEARLQQGVTSKLGINEAVVDAVRKSKFRAATKNGVPVKMWRTVVVDVQP
jgi:protein TonB